MRLFILFFIINTYTSVGDVEAQDNVYDVIVAGRTIGSLKVFDNEPGADNDIHRIESTFKVLFYSGKYSTQASFEDGKLVNAVSAHHVNGDLKERTQTKSINKSAYSVSFSGDDGEKKKSKEFNEPILNTVTSLYYKEPVKITEVYSERYGQMCSVKKLADGSYGVSLPDGKQGVYTYKNGICQEVKTDLAGFKLRIVLNQSKTSLY
ncbi:MAG TPA: DUF6134 family protein [Dyadobacter sp.]|jgi:hypothetical protein|nr:DUF6134 family protein [Dyadobacter sp.]